MRRLIIAPLVASGFLFGMTLCLTAPAGAQTDDIRTWTMDIDGEEWEVHPATPAYEGTTGLFHMPTAYSLPRGRFSASLFRDNVDRDPKDIDISIHGLSLAYGITSGIELFGNFGFQLGIHSEALFQAGRVNEHPFVSRPWQDGTGDLNAGLKIKFLDDYALDPVALAVRGMVKLPLADEEEGLGTGKPSFLADLLLSKNLGDVIDIHGMIGYQVHVDPEEPVEIDLANALRWGVGLNVPACSWFQVQAELTGVSYSGGDDEVIEGATNDPDDGNVFQEGFNPLEDDFGIGPQTNPMDLVIGPVISFRPGIFIRPAISWNLNFDDSGLDDANSMGGHLSIGFHPGFGCHATGMVPVSMNQAPTVTCTSERPGILPGETVRLTASATDPEGDPLTYEWITTTGQVTGSGSTATLDLTGATAPGSATVTVRATDNHGNTASSNCVVSVLETQRPAAVSCVAGVFPRNLSRLNNVDKACLDDVAQRLQSDPRARVTLIGHADSDESAPDAIAQERAEAVRNYLVRERGIEESRITMRWVAATRPLDTGTDVTARARNRRVEVWFAPEGSTVPE
jgi:outer membrane protein OmpA-like peptidoglycan-associated protein